MSSVGPCRIEIALDHPAFDGHFPGHPLLPGVALLAEVLEAAHADADLARCIGAAPQLQVAKFLAPVRPGTVLWLDFRLGPRTLSWTVRDGEQVAASGQFARVDKPVAGPR
jgi:3-hydroxyacyl-[acyl-carrier-protein] dehydratase